MLRTMYSIKNTEEHEYVSVTAEKLQRMYAVSPTLRQIEPEMTQQLAFVDDGTDRVSGDGEVEDGWFFWCIRKALENSKLAPTLPEAEEYYRQVNLELEEAIQTPEIGFETQWTMPSALMSPWREEYAGKILPMTADAFRYMISYEEVSAVPRAQRTEEAKMISLFEGITGDAAIYDGTHLSDYRQLYIKRADFVASVYRAVNPVAAAVSAVLFVGMAVMALMLPNRRPSMAKSLIFRLPLSRSRRSFSTDWHDNTPENFVFSPKTFDTNPSRTLLTSIDRLSLGLSDKTPSAKMRKEPLSMPRWSMLTAESRKAMVAG